MGGLATATLPDCQISLKAKTVVWDEADLRLLESCRCAHTVHNGKETVDRGHSQHSRHMFYVARDAVVGHSSNKKAALLSAAQTVHDGKRCTDYLFSLSHKRLNCRGGNVTSVFSPFPLNRIFSLRVKLEL